MSAATIAAESIAHHVFSNMADSFEAGMQAVATMRPHDIAARRLHPPAAVDNSDEVMGLAASAAPAWLYDAAAAYECWCGRATMKASHYYDERYDVRARPEALTEALHTCVRAERAVLALEAIVLWSADPLPVADIEYATRMVTGQWQPDTSTSFGEEQ